MREIKFRAWDEDGFMFYPTKIEFDKEREGEVLVWDEDIFGHLGSAVVDLMQFTGRLDSTNKEIYEGDIVELKDDSEWQPICLEEDEGGKCTEEKTIAFVAYSKEKGGFVFQHSKIDGCEEDVCEMSGFEQEDIKIIGTIYQDPELLCLNK